MADTKKVTKVLQELSEASDDASPLDWSTISHTHGGGKVQGVEALGAGAGIDSSEAFEIIANLQQLRSPDDASPMEWSTVSHTHGKK